MAFKKRLKYLNLGIITLFYIILSCFIFLLSMMPCPCPYSFRHIFNLQMILQRIHTTTKTKTEYQQEIILAKREKTKYCSYYYGLLYFTFAHNTYPNIVNASNGFGVIFNIKLNEMKQIYKSNRSQNT